MRVAALLLLFFASFLLDSFLISISQQQAAVIDVFGHEAFSPWIGKVLWPWILGLVDRVGTIFSQWVLVPLAILRIAALGYFHPSYLRKGQQGRYTAVAQHGRSCGYGRANKVGASINPFVGADSEEAVIEEGPSLGAASGDTIKKRDSWAAKVKYYSSTVWLQLCRGRVNKVGASINPSAGADSGEAMIGEGPSLGVALGDAVIGEGLALAVDDQVVVFYGVNPWPGVEDSATVRTRRGCKGDQRGIQGQETNPHHPPSARGRLGRPPDIVWKYVFCDPLALRERNLENTEMDPQCFSTNKANWEAVVRCVLCKAPVKGNGPMGIRRHLCSFYKEEDIGCYTADISLCRRPIQEISEEFVFITRNNIEDFLEKQED
ncbi:hypothetical protein SELMODRAFT_406730 [Selaginella moellendorffii]|uniref:BED-type domain-containing protein n=1 Tax=Selaginella moellendorffii TaxID=88036 RepID=D8R199_SELML|nr:hypothetical protein SELMODRAFT_406730 [Selaginella moellendorffii]